MIYIHVRLYISVGYNKTINSSYNHIFYQNNSFQLKLQCTEVSKGAHIRNLYQVPHMTQDTNGKATNLQLDNTNESQEVSPFPTGDYKVQINRRAQRHNKHKIEKT